MYSSFNFFSRAADFPGQSPHPDVLTTLSPFPSAPMVPPPTSNQYCLTPDQLSLPDEFDTSVADKLRLISSDVGNNSPSSGCSSYGSPTSLVSSVTEQSSLIQRSISSHSLLKNGVHHHPISSLFSELLDSETSPVRRVYSTGDLQRIKGIQRHLNHQSSDSPLSSESSMIIESMNRACRYSPEEKKERIERYRSKRNQRNFHKKIKYACRKTLADSRPRIRGRFAKNEEIEKNPPINEWSHISGEEEDQEDDDNWINLLDTLSANLVQ